MAQRVSQFQIIQEDLLKKASKTSSLEREVSFLAALKKCHFLFSSVIKDS